jgi:hypothetical protein
MENAITSKNKCFLLKVRTYKVRTVIIDSKKALSLIGLNEVLSQNLLNLLTPRKSDKEIKQNFYRCAIDNKNNLAVIEYLHNTRRYCTIIDLI